MKKAYADIEGDDLLLHDYMHDHGSPQDQNLRFLELYSEGFLSAWRMLKGVDKESAIELSMVPIPDQPDFLLVSVTAHNSDGRTHSTTHVLDHPCVPFTERREAPDRVDVAQGCNERSEWDREGSPSNEAPRDQEPSQGVRRSFERPPDDDNYLSREWDEP